MIAVLYLALDSLNTSIADSNAAFPLPTGQDAVLMAGLTDALWQDLKLALPACPNCCG